MPRMLVTLRRGRLRVALISLCLLAAVTSLAAEDRWVQLDLQDGSQVSALYVESNAQEITIRQGGVKKKIPLETVKNLNFLSGPPAQATPKVTAPKPSPAAAEPPAEPVQTILPIERPVTPPSAAGGELPPIAPPLAAPPLTPPVPTPGAETTVTVSDGKSVEVPLPTVAEGKTVTVKVPLEWAAAGEAPWLKLTKASSLHQMPGWQRADGAREAEILKEIDGLAHLATGAAAKKKLAAAGDEAVPYLIIFLLDTNPIRAQGCADLLIARGQPDVTKYLIEALFATTDENNRILPEWLAPYARTLVAGCNKLTQADSTADPLKSPFSAAEWVDSWNGGLAAAPAQFGEPPYKPATLPPNAEAQKKAWVTFFHTLALKRVKFVKPPDEKPDLTRRYPRVKDAALDAAIQREIGVLGTGDEPEKETAKAALLRHKWAEVAPYLAQALVEKKDIPTQLILLDLIGQKEDKRATWQVLTLLIESWGPATRIPPPNHAAVIRVADNLLRKLTGLTAQPAVQPTFTGGYRPIQGYIDHWNKHFAEYQPQYGEPELDSALPKYNEYIAELRWIGEKPASGGK